MIDQDRSKYATVKEAMEITGLSRTGLYKKINSGEFQKFKDKGTTKLLESEMYMFLAVRKIRDSAKQGE